MQFREQGKKIQCIRSTYDPSSKRSLQKVIATLDRTVDKLVFSQVSDLTDAEQQELTKWFIARRIAEAERNDERRVMNAASDLAALGQAVRATGAALTDGEAAATWNALTGVAKALRKAGHPKPKRERPASAMSSQGDLLAEAVEPAPTILPPASSGV